MPLKHSLQFHVSICHFYVFVCNVCVWIEFVILLVYQCFGVFHLLCSSPSGGMCYVYAVSPRIVFTLLVLLVPGGGTMFTFSKKQVQM